MATTTEPKAAGNDLPDGVNSESGVLYLARAAGFEGDHVPSICIFDEEMGFSDITGFIKSSNGHGYYRTTLKTCTCPSFKYRGGPCKHQKLLSERLERKARIDARNKALREERAARAARVPSTGNNFNLPEVAA